SAPHAVASSPGSAGAVAPSSPGVFVGAASSAAVVPPVAQSPSAFSQPPMQVPPAAQPHASQPMAMTMHSTGQAPPARLVCIMKDGSDGVAYPLVGEQIDIGRTEGDIIVGDDPYLSPRHARLRRRADGYAVVDLDSVNGVYVRLNESVELTDGDTI